MASAGVGDLAASSLTGEGVAGSSRSQESLVLVNPGWYRLPALQEVIVGHALEEGETLLETAPALALSAYLPLGVELLG